MNNKTRSLTLEEAKFKALECREFAKRATDPSHVVMLDHMADTWNRIAGGITTPTIIVPMEHRCWKKRSCG